MSRFAEVFHGFIFWVFGGFLSDFPLYLDDAVLSRLCRAMRTTILNTDADQHSRYCKLQFCSANFSVSVLASLTSGAFKSKLMLVVILANLNLNTKDDFIVPCSWS